MGASDGSISDTKSTLRQSIAELTPKQFDQLIGFLLEEIDNDAAIEFVTSTSLSGIDLTVTQPHPLVNFSYGIRLERIGVNEAVSEEVIRSVAKGIEEDSIEVGVVISTGEFTQETKGTAERLGVSLIDGSQLASLLLEYELGFTETNGEWVLDESFWELLRGQTRSDTIPSLEIPQADSIERLTQTLTAIATGNHHKDDIAEKVESLSGDSFDPRQADYYGTAGWLLGFLHKDRGGRGRWGLTRLGDSYLSHRENGDTDSAQEILFGQIRDIEIIWRILEVLRTEGEMDRDAITNLVDEETELGGSTVPRRTRTVINWIEKLPEIEVSGRGRTQRLHYLGHDEPTSPAGLPDDTDAMASEPVEDSTGFVNKPPDEDLILDDIMAAFDDSNPS